MTTFLSALGLNPDQVEQMLATADRAPSVPAQSQSLSVQEPEGPVSKSAASIQRYDGQNDITVVLRACGGRVDHVVSAIRDDNDGAGLVITDHGESIEIRASRTLCVTATTLRWHIGRAFGIADLGSMVLSARGAVTVTADRLTVTSV